MKRTPHASEATMKNSMPIWIRRRGDRPLLKNSDPVETLRRLIDERYPTYAEADVTVESREVAHDVIVEEIVAGLRRHMSLAHDASRVDAGSVAP